MLRILLLLLLLGASSAPARAQRPAGAEPPGPTAALAPGAADTGAPPAESAIAHPPRPAAGLRFSLPLPGEDAEILRLLVEGFGATGGTGRTRPGGATGGAEPSGAIGGTHPSGWAGADGGGPAGRGARGARADAAQPASLADAEVRAAFAREWFGRPFRGKLPAEHAVRRRAGFLRLAAATGPEVSFDLASAPREHLLLWGDASHWKERIPGRQHHGGAVGGALLPGGRDARSRLAAGFALRREDWAAWGGNRYPAPGDLRGWRLRASGDRRVVLPGSELVAGAFADFALIETRVCGASGCASPERARARWAIAGARLSSQPARQDQRLWVTGASARPVHDLELGLAATDDRDSGSLARGRWRGDAGIGLRVGREDVVAVLGAGGGGEGSDHAFGPALDIRVRRREQGLLIALEMAPRVVFAEEALAAEELLPPADLLRAAPFAAARPALPESPGLVAARRPPARAWP
ncbi:MAG: hypothetical protein FJY75_10280, partial [Candidatus Eisenbacteria bacterium]|nr:hypothetical protein [Candidatus Eisenbacteria bacterium]